MLSKTISNASPAPISQKELVDAGVQMIHNLDLNSGPGGSPLPLLLNVLQGKKSGSPVDSIVNAVTINWMREILSMKNYVNVALQITTVPDVVCLLGLLLYLLDNGYLSNLDVPDANRRARRLMFKTVTKIPVIPPSLFVEGITIWVDHSYTDRGRFGFVFKGEYRGALVAPKVLHKTLDNNGFFRETLTWRSLRHEFALPFLGVCEAGPTLLLVTPYMKNGTLSQWRKKLDPSIVEIQKRWLRVFSTSIYKENVLLDSNFRAQIADFGLTRRSGATVTRSEGLHYNFAAPELFGIWDTDDDSNSDDDTRLPARTQKSDVYAFGCLYYEIHFDIIPFASMRELQIMRLVSRGKRPPRLEGPAISDRAWSLIKRCWRKDPVRRPAMEDIVETMMV
ncbi:hypothetical protein AX15_005084 [Amanita polypyramis BW_CC]|nr:hypothetical protein AX15_005084 [Amanita polypyramis BW_CC]